MNDQCPLSDEQLYAVWKNLSPWEKNSLIKPLFAYGRAVATAAVEAERKSLASAERLLSSEPTPTPLVNALKKSKKATPDRAALEHDLIVECERAMKQRDAFLRTGQSTAAHGGSHDTCFGYILRKHGIAASPPPMPLTRAQVLTAMEVADWPTNLIAISVQTKLIQFARAIEAAHGIVPKEPKP